MVHHLNFSSKLDRHSVRAFPRVRHCTITVNTYSARKGKSAKTFVETSKFFPRTFIFQIDNIRKIDHKQKLHRKRINSLKWLNKIDETNAWNKYGLLKMIFERRRVCNTTFAPYFFIYCSDSLNSQNTKLIYRISIRKFQRATLDREVRAILEKKW